MGIPQSISQEDDSDCSITPATCRAAELQDYNTLRNPSRFRFGSNNSNNNNNNQRTSSEKKEAIERVRDKLLNASSKWLSNPSSSSFHSPKTFVPSSQPQDSQPSQPSNRKKLLNGVTTNTLRRRAASSPEERDKIISTLALFLSVRESMLKTYLASDWMSTVSIIERMLVPSEFTQFIELAVQEIDDHFDFSEYGDSRSTEDSPGGHKHSRKRRGGILSSVSHHHHRRHQINKKSDVMSPATSCAPNSSKIVNLKLMIVPPLKYHTLVEACFPVIETFLLDPMEMTNCSFGVALVVDHWFLYFEPETNLIIPKKLFSRAKDFVDQNIPTFLRVQQKVNQIENLLAACICKWNSSMYYQAAKMEFHSCTENSQWNSSSLQPFSSDTRVSCSSPTLLIPSTSSSSSSTISSPSSSSMKYYGNSMDFVEDFFVNYLKYDYTQVPTFNYLKSMMTNIREMGSSDLIFDFDSDLSKLIYETSSSNHNNMNSHSENRHHDSTITTTTHNDEVERKNSSLTFLDFHDLELFMDDLSISMQEQQEEFHLQEQECETNAVDNPFVALEILKAAFEIQYLEENDDHDGEGSVDF